MQRLRRMWRAPQLSKQAAGREQRRQAGLEVGRGAVQEAVLQHDVCAAEAAAARLQARRPLCRSRPVGA